MRKKSTIAAILLVVFCAVLGWWLVRDLRATLFPPRHPKATQSGEKRDASGKTHAPPPLSFRVAKRDEFDDGATVEMLASRHPGETILHFPSAESYGAFLSALAQSDVRLEDRLDPLHAMRLSYEDPDDLDLLLQNENIKLRNALATVPDRPFPTDNLQPGAIGFGDAMPGWLGIRGDHSKWGAGVRIAVLDTGIVPHPTLPPLASSIALTPFPDDLSLTHGHGTAVASLIAGSHPSASGIAPSAGLISIRISDEDGVTDAFDLAKGILAAIEEDAHLINLSLGSYENSSLLRTVIELAQNQGIVIIAAAGNDGQSSAAYPAAYPGVISVGAVDGRGVHLDFSNYGDYLYITAPGYFINAAWPGDRYVKFSGTSASAPIVTGIIAAVMSDGRGPAISASDAVQLVARFANDAGLPGPDSEYGFGIVDMRRILNRAVPGIIDAAITDQRLVATSAGAEVQVTVQNRGTATLLNTLVQLDGPGGTRRINATTIAPGAIQTFPFPIDPRTLSAGQPLRISTTLTVQGADITPDNNQRTDTFEPH